MKDLMLEMPSMENTLYSREYEHDNCGAGFICSLKGEKSNSIIHKALQILERLEHRGAVSSDGRTGDGAGVLIDLPHNFFSENTNFEIPNAGEYAVAMTFMPQKETQYQAVKSSFEAVLKEKNIEVLGWRAVPVDSENLGAVASKSEPRVVQLFVKKPDELNELSFRKKLFIVRKTIENRVVNSGLSESKVFYISSFSDKTIIYKGLLQPEDISRYYVDLMDEKLTTRMALVHQRFATNTFPTWELAQPFRYMCHNGEINTVRGNVSRMRAREELLTNENFGEDIKDILPIIQGYKSDSATMDLVLELLLMTERTLPEVMMMMVPEAWEKHNDMSDEKKAFYEYNSCIMEPWDGPASIPFTDGKYLGAILDRNGLRPSRYTVTKDGFVIMSSETGVLDTPPENIKYQGRLEPGKMFLVDMNKGEIVDDETIKNHVVNKKPYRKWLTDNVVHLGDLPKTIEKAPSEPLDLMTRKKVFGYTKEHLDNIVKVMAEKGKEPMGSMGTDTPIAVLSDKPQLLYNYFKQLFAQVTNPPLDGIREEIVTDISLAIGEDQNVFNIDELHAKKLRVQNPVLTLEDVIRIRDYQHPNLTTATIPILYQISKGTNGLIDALEKIVKLSEKAIKDGAKLLILSDRGINEEFGPIPALMACSYVHHSLNQVGLRSKCAIIIESAEPREVHHFAMLFGYGASAVCPYLVYEVIDEMILKGKLSYSYEQCIYNFQKAVGAGVVKVMNKIGVSTLHSYRSSQLFEALGLKSDLVNKYFPFTATRIEGVGILALHEEISLRLHKAFPENENLKDLPLEIGGEYRWRRDGEKHMLNPGTVSKLQEAVRQNKPIVYQEYSEMINNQSEQLMTIRGLMEFKDFDPIPIEEVEPWTEIVKRFKTGAMSYGSISQEAHETLAIAMNRIGGKSNSGEGGENPNRFQKDEFGNLKNSAIKQVASGRFGVSINYLSNAKEIQIKMAQGAKPGEGGQLPGEKVYPWIAEVRNSTPYVGLISPPPHHDIYSIEDLAELIFDLKNANRKARINVKLVSEVGIGTVASGVAKAKADVILISGYDGGTGASPITSLKHAGIPWELGLSEAQQTLVANDLRSRIVLECDGQLKTGRDVAIACLLGAEEFGFSTAPLVATGCIMMRVCHLNTCPVGIATQNPELRKKFEGKPEHVINYFYFVAEEIRQIMAQLGFKKIDEMIGQVQKLKKRDNINHYKAKGINLDRVLSKIQVPDYVGLKNTSKQDHALENVLDFDILQKSQMAIMRKESIELDYKIMNTDRATGTILSNEISKKYGEIGLPEDTLKLKFSGSAGQSFGAFGAPGITMTLYGNANDYLGKGVSGAKIIVRKPLKADFEASKNVIAGNVLFYGGIKGEAYINGLAGERFCVRNSGVNAVVEGIGDHGCEYMTGGRVVILGHTGRNFAAGMSGGIAYVLDEKGDFIEKRCNKEMVEFDPLEEEDLSTLRQMVSKHYEYTESDLAKKILDNWDTYLSKFIKVIPTDYKYAINMIKEESLGEVGLN